MFNIFIFILSLAGLLSFLNFKFLKLPETIGIMILSIGVSLIFLIYSYIDRESYHSICAVVQTIDFRTILFEFLLGILLFAGAINVNLLGLLKEKSAVFTYATIGVLISTFAVGTLFYVVAVTLGFQINYIYALVFGALISPTDPVAVLALLKKSGAPKNLEVKIIGESLFNDGVGIVVFLSILSLATMMQEFSIISIGEEFAKEAGGGFLVGLIIGYLGLICIKSAMKEPIIAVHISLAIVLGGYSLSNAFHLSGAIAMVVAGLIIGNGLQKKGITHNLKTHVSMFWKVLDEIFNAVLFVLIGIEIVRLEFELTIFLIGLVSILIVLIVRLTTIFFSNIFLAKRHRVSKRESIILAWAGLRGGISIALVLLLPEGEIRDGLLLVTYIVVVFSIVVQGLTIEKLIKKLLG